MNAQRWVRVLFITSMLFVLTGPVMLTVATSDALIYSLSLGAVQISTTAVGAIVASRLPTNTVGWILLALGWTLGLSNTVSAYGALGIITSHGPLPADEIAAWLGSWSFVPIVYGGVVLLLYLFPDGRFISGAWRRAGLITGVIVFWATVNDALLPGRLDDATRIQNPVAATGRLADVVTTAETITALLALPGFGLAVAALVMRFRRSRGIERQQLKWISSALLLMGITLGMTPLTAGVAGGITFFLALFALAAMPVAVGVAMLRYRLYDIDVVINRALVYGALTAILAGVYLGAVLLLGLVLNPIAGGSGLSIAASTLAVAALFRPARGRVQEIVDRRFFRQKYDAARTLDRFGAHLRDQVDLADIGADLLAVVGETVQPAHASVWLRGQEAE
jgi:hypothetical protein